MNINKKISIISFLIILLFLSVCLQLNIARQCIAQQTAASNPESNVFSAQTGDDAVIGHLQTKDKIVTIRSDTDGPLYTVKSKDGEILAIDLTTEDLYAEFPELKNIIENGLAGEDARVRINEDQ